MSSLLESLLDTDYRSETPELVLVKVNAVSNDSALVSFTHAGKSANGILPVHSANPRMPWTVGSEAIVLKVASHPQPLFSATDTRLVERLFASLVPEIRSGEVRVMGVVRRAGVRTKIAVGATREGLDPVAALVGRGHNRVDYVKAALMGEQVDVVSYHPDPKTFLANALQPAKVSDVRIDEVKEIGYAKAPAHQMAAAVGGGGLNSSLAAALLGLSGVNITAQ